MPLIAAVILAIPALSQSPVANFSASTTAGCSPLLINFSDQSTGGPSSWLWDFGNGNTSTLQNPGAVYLTPGTYTVKLTVTNASGSNSLTKTQYITVYENPTVDFSGIPSNGCFPLRVQFNDLSSAGAGNSLTNWLWDFGNGNSSTLQNPFIIFPTVGVYSVTLKVTNDKGCNKALTKPNYINVTAGVISNFTNTQATVCHPPTNISFTNTSTGPGALSYSWNFGDGGTSTLQNPSHIFSSGGTFNVTLTTTSSGGCFDSIVHTLSITNNTTAINAPDSICVNYPVSFLNASSPSPASASWDFADGTTSTQINPMKIYTTAGTYLVKLINSYSNCQDSAFKTIKILARPVANFTAPVTAQCQPPLTVNFQDLSTGAATWQWNFGDGGTSTLQNPQHIYNTYGNFDVTLIITNASGCSDTIKKTQFIKIDRAQISIPSLPTRGCIPFTINPVANIVAVDAITSYLWDFGDGTTSTAATPTHVYPTQGTYTVKLFITTSTGCTDSLVIPSAVKVGSKPNADFSAAPIPQCAYQPVQFTDLSTPFVDEWLWDFGDGTTSTAQNPTHSYTSVGPLTVTLIATNNGCPDTKVRNNYTNSLPPIARFNYTANCSNRLQLNFTDQSIGPVSWSWDFGDGTTSTLQNPVHNFPSLGVYNVTLTVTNGSCTHSSTQIARTIDENPDFVSNTQSGCKSLYVVLTAQNINNANIVNYAWSFDNITFTNTAAPTMFSFYNTSGTYTAGLITTDLNGCKDTIIKPNYIRVNGPVANFTATNTAGCKGLTTTFNDLSTTDGIHAITNWQWDFGDGTIQNFSAPPFQHVYNTAGTYSVKLRVTDASGCLDSLLVPNLVTASDPRAQFTSADTLTCPAAIVNFINQSSAVNYTNNWSFGDGGSSTTNSPTHSYLPVGNYDIKLVITDQYGCSDSITKSSFIKVSRPVAAFNVSDSVSSCSPFEVHFTNTSQYFSSSFWDFGTGATSTLNNPSYFYSSPGVYTAKLIITSPGGCKDSITKTISLFDTAGSRINYLPLGGCKPLSATLNAIASGPQTYLWDFGDGTTQTTLSPNANHIYNSIGNFLPKMIMQTNATCFVPITGPDTIHVIGGTANFGINNNIFCDTGKVNFIDSTIFNDPILSYNWSFGDGNFSNLQNPNHQYNAPGFYNVSLDIQTQSGCKDTVQKNNLIKIVQRPLITIGGGSSVCIYDPLTNNGQFLIPDTSVVKWNWTFPNGNNSNNQNPPAQVYTSSGNFLITTIATNSTGCKDTAIKNITVFSLPVVTMPASMTMQAGFPVQIPATYSPNTNSYVWTPSGSLSCNNCPQPIASPKFNTTYKLLFTDSNGCRNTAAINIVVICKNVNLFIPNTFSPNGDGSNDVFYPRGKGIFRIRSMTIYNRWGEVVFNVREFPANDPTFGWNGTFKGNKPQPGVYIFQVEFYCDNGELFTLNGDVTLLL